MRYWVEETYHIECSDTEAERLFNAFPTWAGTAHVAELLDDFDMALSRGKDGIHEVHFSCSVDTVHEEEAVFAGALRDTTFESRASGVGQALLEAHRVVTAFMSLHDSGTWRVHDGITRLTSSGDGEDIEHPYLLLTLHHGERDLSLMYAMPDPSPWFSHYDN